MALLLLALVPVAALAQGITATPLPPLPGTATTPLDPRTPRPPPAIPRASIKPPSVLGPLTPVVKPPPGPAAQKPRHHVKPAPHPAPHPAPYPATAEPATHPVPHPLAKPAPKVVVAPPAPPPVVAVAPPPPPPPKPDPNKGTATGLPVPRWAALRSDEVNLRAGPGMDRPIDWQYHRRDLPVRIEREYEVWRLVEDQDGTKGWVHQAVLTGRRGFVVTGEERVLRSAASDAADAVARLKPGVVGVIRGCAAGSPWCEVKTGEFRGWLKRTDLYGVDADEAVNP